MSVKVQLRPCHRTSTLQVPRMLGIVLSLVPIQDTLVWHDTLYSDSAGAHGIWNVGEVSVGGLVNKLVDVLEQTFALLHLILSIN